MSEAETVAVYESGSSPRTFASHDELTLPAVLAGFCAPVRELFE